MFGYKLDTLRAGVGTIAGRQLEDPPSGIVIPIGQMPEPFQRGGQIATRPLGQIVNQRFEGTEALNALNFVREQNREQLRRCIQERGHLPRNVSSLSMSPTLARRLQRLGICA